MSFSHPGAFFIFIFLALFVVIAIYNFKKKRTLLNRFISVSAFKKIGVRSGSEIDFFKTALICGALFFFILALAGPQWGEKLENVDVRGIEMVFLMDTSNSMNAEDLKPSRIEVAKQLVTGVVDNLKTDYIGLVNFAGAAYVQCPLTVDYDAFKLMTEASSISPSEEQGTDFNEAFRLALKTFNKSARTNKKIIVLITDGEDQERSWQSSLSEIKSNEIVVFTVGIGAPNGAPIPLKDKEGNLTGWKKDKSGEIVKTRIDENTLIRIASQTGGQYFRLTDASAVDHFIHILKTFDRNVLRRTLKLNKIKRFQYPLIIGIILLLLELILSERKLTKLTWNRKERKTEHG
ncbi:MAG: VWA domain-containing protein [Candidatus Omnitrophota bacterium]